MTTPPGQTDESAADGLTSTGAPATSASDKAVFIGRQPIFDHNLNLLHLFLC